MLYILLNTVVNFGFAWLLRTCVLKYKWFGSIPFLAIYNRWYQIHKPEAGDDGVVSVWIDLLVETKTGDVLYRGFLSDFWLDKEGCLSQLHFENVRRRVFKDDASQNENYDDSTEEVDSRYYYIPGELFIIKYAHVKNMNITYYEETLVAA